MIQAVNDYVLVEPISRRQQQNQQLESIGLKGLDKGPEGVPNMGKVLNISPSITEPELALGDIVIFDEPQPQGATIKGQRYLPISYSKIIGRVA